MSGLRGVATGSISEPSTCAAPLGAPVSQGQSQKPEPQGEAWRGRGGAPSSKVRGRAWTPSMEGSTARGRRRCPGLQSQKTSVRPVGVSERVGRLHQHVNASPPPHRLPPGFSAAPQQPVIPPMLAIARTDLADTAIPGLLCLPAWGRKGGGERGSRRGNRSGNRRGGRNGGGKGVGEGEERPRKLCAAHRGPGQGMWAREMGIAGREVGALRPGRGWGAGHGSWDKSRTRLSGPGGCARKPGPAHLSWQRGPR